MNPLKAERRGRDVGAMLFASSLMIAGACSSTPSTPTPKQAAADSVVASTHLLTGRRHHLPRGLGSVNLPSTFALTDCDGDHICQIIQNDDAYQAVCDGGATTLDLTVARTRGEVSVTWTGTEDAECSATLVDGQLSGSCETAAGSCDVYTHEALPSPRCVELPNHLTFSGCDLPTVECEVIQSGCIWQGRCGDGNTFIGGRANATGARWTREDGLRCTSTLENGTLTGTCAPPPPPEDGEPVPEDAGTPAESCDWSATQPEDAPAPPTCDPLPKTFAVDVCGSDTLCNVLQRGCIWEAHCEEDLFAGRAEGNVYKFNDGTCTLSVEDGHFTGSCEDEEGSCTLTEKEPVPSSTCKTIPSVFELNGCGLEGECKTIQNGCVWQSSCNDDAIIYNGYATELGITLNGTVGENLDVPAACQAVFDEDGTLHGGCSPLSDNVADGGTAPMACEFTGTPAPAAPATP